MRAGTLRRTVANEFCYRRSLCNAPRLVPEFFLQRNLESGLSEDGQMKRAGSASRHGRKRLGTRFSVGFVVEGACLGGRRQVLRAKKNVIGKARPRAGLFVWAKHCGYGPLVVSDKRLSGNAVTTRISTLLSTCRMSLIGAGRLFFARCRWNAESKAIIKKLTAWRLPRSARLRLPAAWTGLCLVLKRRIVR